MKDEIEFAGTGSYSTGGFTTRFGELSRVEKVLIQPDDEVLGASGGSVRTLRLTAASPDANQVTIQVYETATSPAATMNELAGGDLSSITLYGFAEGT